jgi:5,5'-dehydrodivanillate O-demethylase
MGEVLRRYWWPVAIAQEVRNKPVPVRLLGQDFVVFRTGSGRWGLLDRLCAHRGTSLEYGRVEQDGLRCCYHGWLYAPSGQCLDQPIEPEGSTYIDKVRMAAYPTQEAGGFVFVYLGPQPAPVLPHLDVFDRRDGTHVLEMGVDYCNWLQRAENGVDQGHLGVLHASMYPHLALKRPRYEWQPTAYGVRNVLYIDGEPPRVTHFIFPSHSRISTTPRTGYIPSHDLRFRVPTDDTTTTTFADRFQPNKDGSFGIVVRPVDRPVPGAYERVEDGWWDIPSNIQDRVAQEGQGVIADRSIEHLAASDRGVIMFRKMLEESMQAVAVGQDPFGIFRDPEQARLTFDSTLPEQAYAS